MPKKPFTQEEIDLQRERIMDNASIVMAEVGFHHLSMRKLAVQLGMTASNIYNYFPDKEALFICSRKRGFELFFKHALTPSKNPLAALRAFANGTVDFASQYPGYYQLMFQPPRLSLDEAPQDMSVQLQVDRLLEEWQRHVMSLVVDALPTLADQPEAVRARFALFFASSIHGIVDFYRHRSTPLFLEGVDLIADEVLKNQIEWILEAIEQKVALLHEQRV